MADRIIKPDSGNDVVIQNNGGTRKIEVTNSGDVEVTGDFKATTVKATNLKANDGTASLEIADSTGDIGFSGNTNLKLKLPSAGGIYESDGSTEILTESSGTVSLKNTLLDPTVTQANALYASGVFGANHTLVGGAEMINLTGTTAPYFTFSGGVNSFGNGSGNVTGSTDHDFKFLTKGIYYINFNLNVFFPSSDTARIFQAQIRGNGSASEDTTIIARGLGQVADTASSSDDYGSADATFVGLFNANDQINFFVSASTQNDPTINSSSAINLFLIRAVA